MASSSRSILLQLVFPCAPKHSFGLRLSKSRQW